MKATMTVSDFVYAGIFCALTIVLGFVSIPLPISPVPISGQSLGIMLAGSILTVRQAAYSIVTFLLLGAIGIPVFSGFMGGIGVLFGPRGGYFFGFLFGVMLIACCKGKTGSIWRLAAANLLGGIGVVYFFGALWLSFITDIDLTKAMVIGVLPFVPGDLFKVAIAAVIGAMVNRQRQRFMRV